MRDFAREARKKESHHVANFINPLEDIESTFPPPTFEQ
jgi:hypothetical protein